MSFGMNGNAHEFEKDMGEYVVVYLGDSRTCAGKVCDVSGDYVSLNPFMSGEWEKQGLVRKLMKNKRPQRIRRDVIGIIEPTTKENIEHYCQHLDSQENSKDKSSKE